MRADTYKKPKQMLKSTRLFACFFYFMPIRQASERDNP